MDRFPDDAFEASDTKPAPSVVCGSLVRIGMRRRSRLVDGARKRPANHPRVSGS